jgi:hypothetical protein
MPTNKSGKFVDLGAARHSGLNSSDSTRNRRSLRGLGGHAVSIAMFLLLLLLCSAFYPQDSMAEIVIPNTLRGVGMAPRAYYDTGPCVGEILNAHFFPGLEDFRRGNYAYAAQQMDYFIARPQYTVMNPRQSEFMSTALYLRGTIYLDHAAGPGRLARALRDLSEATRWNPANEPAYLALARAQTTLGQETKAAETLRSLLGRQPSQEIAGEAARLLQSLSGKP